MRTIATGNTKSTSSNLAAADTYTSAVTPKTATDIRITGTFSATVVVQEQYPDGSWLAIPGLSYTAAAAVTHTPAVARPLRLYMTARVSGTAVCTLWAN